MERGETYSRRTEMKKQIKEKYLIKYRTGYSIAGRVRVMDY
jgi:hypothetical protein